ncbi:hypothetical protein L0337_46100 [candidate division KSB1 bacterium]|nr:hypothetical protein [candidate division KSB1 bacterium]
MKLILMSTSNYEIGLCQTCRNVRVVNSGRGGTFYLCRLAAHDPRFPKYPRLPVLVCNGYEPTDTSKLQGNEPPRSENESK